VRALVGRAEPARLGSGAQLPSRLGLQVQRSELIEADRDRPAPIGQLVELDDPVARGFMVRIAGALPRPHRLKADALLAQQQPQDLVATNVDDDHAVRV
jgi:hypothetical protein